MGSIKPLDGRRANIRKNPVAYCCPLANVYAMPKKWVTEISQTLYCIYYLYLLLYCHSILGRIKCIRLGPLWPMIQQRGVSVSLFVSLWDCPISVTPLLCAARSSAIADKPHQRLCTPRCAVRSCHLVNDCDLVAWFSDLPISHVTSLMRRIPFIYRIHIWYGKTTIAGLQSDEASTMIDCRLGTIHQRTDTQTATSP